MDVVHQPLYLSDYPTEEALLFLRLLTEAKVQTVIQYPQIGSLINSSRLILHQSYQKSQIHKTHNKDMRAVFDVWYMNIEIIGLKFDFYFNFDFELPKDETKSKSRAN